MIKSHNLINFFGIYLIFIFFTLLLHHSALNGFLRFDDGEHMKFAVTYAPWDYFFNPDITLMQSYANLTPWNALFYDINMALFHFNIRYHYAHLLFIIASIAVATYYLVKIYQLKKVAFVAASIFLVGLPTTHVAQQLMVGHYATGLLFSILSLYLFVLGMRENRWAFILASALLYLLATSCKEIYVPLVIILFVIPIDSLKRRVLYILPFIFIAIFYIIWRYTVLGSLMGGYQVGYEYKLEQIVNIPSLLFSIESDNYFSMILPFIIGIGLLVAFIKRNIHILLFAIALIILFLPIIPLTKAPGINEPDRYLFLIWWAASILFSVVLFVINKRGILAALVIMVLIFNQQKELKNLKINYAYHDAIYKYATQPIENSVLFPEYARGYFYEVLTSANMVYSKNKGDVHKINIATDVYELCKFMQNGYKLMMYDKDEKVLKDATTLSNQIIADMQKSNTQSIIGKDMEIELAREGKFLKWSFAGEDAIKYAIFLNGDETPLSQKGQVPIVKDSIDYKIQLKITSVDGLIAMSPRFELNLGKNERFYWKGKSIDNKITCSLKDHANEIN